MTYDPRAFWDQRLREQFDLRGTGEPGLPLAYNRACYELRRRVLDRALREADADPSGRRVLDVGCGTGFFTSYYLQRGATVTGLDISPTSVEKLSARHPNATFRLADVGAAPIEGRFDIVNAFDVLYHITDDARWEAAVRHLCAATDAHGLLLLTDTFSEVPGIAVHNVVRSLGRYRALIEAGGLEIRALYPTHVLLNRELGGLRFLNRAPAMLYGVDRALLALGVGEDDPKVSKLLVARRRALPAV